MAFKRKSVYSVKEAVEIAYENMDRVFHGVTLVNLVRIHLQRKSCYDETIFRRLRELRYENPSKFSYKVINRERSIFEKQS